MRLTAPHARDYSVSCHRFQAQIPGAVPLVPLGGWASFSWSSSSQPPHREREPEGHPADRPARYAAAYPDCDIMLADCNGKDLVNAFDIDPFVELLIGG